MKNGAQPLVLIADYDDEERCLLKAILKFIGFDVMEAADGQQALKLAKDKLPDLLLVELDLPVVNGFSVIRQLRKQAQARDLPIATVSLSAPGARQNSLGLGNAAHWEKPVDFNKLFALIDRLWPGYRRALAGV